MSRRGPRTIAAPAAGCSGARRLARPETGGTPWRNANGHVDRSSFAYTGARLHGRPAPALAGSPDARRRRGVGRFALLVVPAALALCSPALAGAEEGARTWSPAPASVCDRPQHGALAYGYPIKPFDRQHPIRGNFGDPRTLASESEPGRTSPRMPGSYSFHNGVDISAATGAAVYPVVSGTARVGYGDEVIVDTRDGRIFQYFHVRPAVAPGQQVVAYTTLIGHVLPRWLHVHLSEIDGFRVHNPVDPGHLEPYHDHTLPVVHVIEATTVAGSPIAELHLHGLVRFAAGASDEPPVPVPGSWFGFPVTPALVQWRLTARAGPTAVPWRTAADFRRREPPNRRFWDVYAPGTFQNFPVFGDEYFFQRAGRYMFQLTPRPLDTRLLPNGRYGLTVRAADVCGNSSTATVAVQIENAHSLFDRPGGSGRRR